jgi:hypothetical protein
MVNGSYRPDFSLPDLETHPVTPCPEFPITRRVASMGIGAAAVGVTGEV